MTKRERLLSILNTLHCGNMGELTKLQLRYAPEERLPQIARLVAIFVRWEAKFRRAQR